MKRLGDKLGPGAAVQEKVMDATGKIVTEPSDVPTCLKVGDEHAFACEFRPLDGRCFVLPYHHFDWCEGPPEGGKLRAMFWSHEVLITGKNLRPLKEALATAKNFTLVALPEKFESRLGKDEIFVWDIQVKAKRDKKGPGAPVDPAVPPDPVTSDEGES